MLLSSELACQYNDLAVLMIHNSYVAMRMHDNLMIMISLHNKLIMINPVQGLTFKLQYRNTS